MFRALKSLLAGIVAGTALGVLFSPKKGTEIRREIKKELKSGGSGLHAVKSTLTEMGKDVKDTVSETQTYKKGAAKAKKYAGKAKREATKLINENLTVKQKKQASQALEKAKSQAKKTVNAVAKKIVNKTS